MQANKSKKHKIPAFEQHLVHATVEDVQFDKKTGKRLSKPQIAKYDVPTFLRLEEYKAWGEKEVVILHEPDALVKAYAANKGKKKAGSDLTDEETE